MVSCTHMWWLTMRWNSSSRGSNASFWPPQELHAHGAQKLTQAYTYTHTHKHSLKLNFALEGFCHRAVEKAQM